jgi:hypothetical protein
VAFLLAALEPPTNLARRVRELQESLYRRWGLASPLALPPLIPLAFLDPGGSEIEEGGPRDLAEPTGAAPGARAVRRLAEDLRSALRGAAAPRAPRLRTGGLAVAGEMGAGPGAAALYWELAGEAELDAVRQELAALADLVCARAQAGPGWPALLPRPFPPHPGFFLALQESELDLRRVASELPPPQPLSFPAAAVTLLRVRRLPLEPLAAEEGPLPGAASPIEQPPWWRALIWEELLNLPLKKPPRRRPQESG